MRVSHRLDAKFEYSWNFKTFLASIGALQATIKHMDFIFPLPAPRSVTYPLCKYESMDMHS